MKSNLISKSETSKILGHINSQWKIELPKQKNIKTHNVNENGVIITGNGITAVKIGDDILPFLDDIPILEKFPYVTVDMGAVKSVRAASMRDSASGDNIDVLVMTKDGAKETTQNIN